MRRDLLVLRDILLVVEAADGPFDLTDGRLEAHDFADLAHHAELLIEAGLLKGEVVYSDSLGVPVYVRIIRLTWPGHEFVALARDERLWRQALAACPEGPDSLTFEMLSELLVEAGRNRLTGAKLRVH
jgi:hypothetical protein